LKERKFGYVFALLIVIVFLSCTTQDQKAANEKIDPSDISIILNDGDEEIVRMKEPFQPDEKQKEKLRRIVYESDKDAYFDGNPYHILVDGVPYFPYPYIKDKKGYSFHPMALGKYIKNNAESLDLDAILNTSVILPNYGMAWFYPDNYLNLRMQGPYWKYSCISQGTILAGLTRIGESGGDFSLASSAFIGMLYPFYDGGINLEDRALLEMPSYLAAPEIVLNGWLDSLFNMSDYAHTTQDPAAIELLYKNYSFLAEIIANFDDEEHKLSRYSDLCPYKVRIYFDKANKGFIGDFQVLYKPKVPGLKAILIPLRQLQQDTLSIYDNQIVKATDSYMDVYISISGLYDTFLVSDIDFTCSIRAGSVNPSSTTPGSSGIAQLAKAEDISGKRVVDFSKLFNGLIAGYPTPFSKYGKYNYYHVYHIVALMLMAKDDLVSDSQRQELLHYAMKWYDYMNTKQISEKHEFYLPENMLEDINKNQYKIEEDNWSELFEWAKTEYARLTAQLETN